MPPAHINTAPTIANAAGKIVLFDVPQATIPLAHVMLKRRVVLAFMLRDRLPPALFERLRSGTGRRYGRHHRR